MYLAKTYKRKTVRLQFVQTGTKNQPLSACQTDECSEWHEMHDGQERWVRVNTVLPLP
jgi:hypothetical protein